MDLIDNKKVKKSCCSNKDNIAARSRGITSIESYCKKCGYIIDIKSLDTNNNITLT